MRYLVMFKEFTQNARSKANILSTRNFRPPRAPFRHSQLIDVFNNAILWLSHEVDDEVND